jgi:hypothetical protein
MTGAGTRTHSEETTELQQVPRILSFLGFFLSRVEKQTLDSLPFSLYRSRPKRAQDWGGIWFHCGLSSYEQSLRRSHGDGH